MAKVIPHRELRNRSSDVLRAVQAGESFEITNHGEVVALLSPPTQGMDLRVRKARVHGGFSQLPLVRRGQSVQDVLDDLRGER